jgi:hypothetical protein
MSRLVENRFACFVLFLSLIILAPLRAEAWGVSGHRIVAMIAENHLTQRARLRVTQLLGDDVTLASVASFADEIRNSRPETKQFHFVDIPLAANNYDSNRDCPETDEGDCVIAAIERFRRELSSEGESVGRRRFALKFLVHLIGDMHQPLHCADNNDRGGNDVKVTWFGRSGKGINLHSVWDSLIIEEAALEDAEFAEALEEGLTTQSIQTRQSGTIIQWALEAHKAARNHAYRIPRNKRLGQAYYDRTFAVVDEQLLRGGLRLAKILNDTLQ